MSNDFARQLEKLRPQLLRFARTQLRNEAWAEDAVSETLVAALEKPHAFAGQSQLKTWLVGILKHKVLDPLRRHKREATILTSDDNEDLDDLLFASDGHWREILDSPRRKSRTYQSSRAAASAVAVRAVARAFSDSLLLRPDRSPGV